MRCASTYLNYLAPNDLSWMKALITLSPDTGKIPSVGQGVVATTACINQDRECCVGELDIAVRNCSAWVAYRLVPTPACNMGYCVGEGVPCPEGLASTNGYTPCDCKYTTTEKRPQFRLKVEKL